MGTGGSRGEPHNEFRTACKTSRPTTPGKCGALDGAGTTARHIESMICASKSQRSGRGRQNFENSPTAQTTRILPAPIRSTPTALPSPPQEGALLALLSVCVPVTALGLFCTAHPLRLCRPLAEGVVPAYPKNFSKNTVLLRFGAAFMPFFVYR